MQTIRQSLFLVSAALLLAACQSGDGPDANNAAITLPQGITLLETVERADGDGIVIPYKKFH